MNEETDTDAMEEDNSDLDDEMDCEEDDWFDVDGEEVPLDDVELLPMRLSCSAHTANLVSTTDMKKAIDGNQLLKKAHTQMMKRCSLLWKKAKYRNGKEIMKAELGVILKRPIIVRWNSLHDSLSQVEEFQEEIPDVSRKLKVKRLLTASNFNYIHHYVECTEAISKFISAIQGDIHYGYLLPLLLNLRHRLNQLRSEYFSCQYKARFLPLIDAQLEGLSKRFKDFYDVENRGILAAVATFLQPRYKNKRWMKRFPEDKKVEVIEKIKECIVRHCAQPLQPEDVVRDENESEEDNSFLVFSPDTMEVDDENEFQQLDVHVELSKYVNDSRKELEMLHDYALLKDLFFKFNTPAPSSASVERLFCYATYMSAPRNARLSPRRFEQRVICMANSEKL